MSSRIVRVYQEDGDRVPVWTVTGPGVIVSGFSSPEKAIEKYKASAKLNGVDVDSLTYERGRWVKTWVKDE